MKVQYDKRHIESGWQQVENTFHTAGMAEPAPGFVTRFQTRLVKQRAQDERKQAWRVLVIYAAIALVLLSTIGYLWAQTINEPSDLILLWAGLVSKIWVYIKMFVSIFLSLGRTLPNLVPYSWWITMVSFVGGTVLFWALTVRQYLSLDGAVL